MPLEIYSTAVINFSQEIIVQPEVKTGKASRVCGAPFDGINIHLKLYTFCSQVTVIVFDKFEKIMYSVYC